MGLKTKSYLLDQITGIHVNKRLLTCDLEITIAGMSKQQSGGFGAAAASETVVQFSTGLYKDSLELVKLINRLIQSRKSGVVSNTNTVPDKDDPAEVLDKLLKLKNDGIITDEEYEDKRKEVIRRI